MASGGSTFELYDLFLPRKVISPQIRERAGRVLAAAVAGTPRVTGRLAAGWSIEPGWYPAIFFVVNDVEYAKYVEYGTRRRPAAAMLGRASAAGR